MTAEEFLNKKYPIKEDWDYLTLFSRIQTAEFAEAYHKQEVEAITDDEIFKCVKHSAHGITVYLDGVTSIRNFKNKLLKQ